MLSPNWLGTDMAKGEALDRKGLIEEAYRIDGITAAECRSIFLDWALSFDGDMADGLKAVIAKHANEPDDHPMSQVLRDGLSAPSAPKRRGGRRARVAD